MKNLKLKYLLSLFLTVFLIAGYNLSDTDKYLVSSNENVLKIGATENDEENSDIKTSNDALIAGENQNSNISATENKKIEYGKIYTSKDEVALYIHTYNELPINFITKTDAKKLGWNAKAGNLRKIKKNASIGGDTFSNRENKLPKKDGRTWKECDIEYEGETFRLYGLRKYKQIIKGDEEIAKELQNRN